MKNLLKLYSYLDNYLWKIVKLVIISSLVAIMQSVLPLAVKEIIDLISKSAGSRVLSPEVIFWLFVLLTAEVARNAGQFIQERYEDRQGVEVALKLRDKVMGLILLKLSPSYIENIGTGNLMQRIFDGANQFRNWLSSSIYTLSSIVLAIIAVVVIFTKSPSAALLFIIVFGPLQYYFVWKKAKLTKPMIEKWNEAGSQSTNVINETLANLATIKSLSAETVVLRKFNKANAVVASLSSETMNTQQIYNTARDLSASLYQVSAVAIAALSAIYAGLSASDVFVFAAFANNLSSSLGPIVRLWGLTTEAEIAARRLVEFLDLEPNVKDRPDALPLLALESIEFKNVGFSYPDGKKGAITNITFKIEGNKTVALVGPSGTGKSTITKLLLRFYEPTEGEILINGQDISGFTQESIRQHIGMVMQDVALFNATVEENLAMANARADKTAIVHAAKQAHADEFIQELPKKYKTLVGERGVKLSGGQKQRIAIARAILKDPQLIILDEATSALDSESERLVQDGLKKLMAGRSALVIAHRLSTIMHADEILVLKNGKVAERGNHSDLINQTGLYKKLFDLQSASGKVKL